MFLCACRHPLILTTLDGGSVRGDVARVSRLLNTLHKSELGESIRNAKVKALLENSDTILSEVYKEIFECTRYQE